jgi:hypothetical protein
MKSSVSLNGVSFRITAAALGLASMSHAAQLSSTPAGRSLLDNYCVTCHNDRLKTGGLSLEKINLADVKGNTRVLEAVVRKLRSHLMPPEGLPRPDQATADTFAATLEASLDRAAGANANPGRVAVHRLNRAEYVNAVHDLLAVDIDGKELLPGDMAGFGFDNNADVLAITPALLARYMSAATKVSRVALGSPDNLPMAKVYKVEPGTRQDARMGEEMPLATHGGLGVHHTFPLDGEYVFRIRLKRNGTVGTIEGIGEDVNQIELRLDYGLVKRFRIGGEFKGQDPGVYIAVGENDVEAAKMHNYRLDADNELEIRFPVKAGTRLVSAAFTDSLPVPGDAGRRRGGNQDDGIPGIDTLEIVGPFDGKTPQDSPSRRRILTCRPATRQAEEPCARKIISTLVRRAYRQPATAADIEPLVNIYKEGQAARDFDAGIERAIEALLSSPKFLIRLERQPADVKPGETYRISDLELASRLSFFLWQSIPDDPLLALAERGRLSERAVLDGQVQRMLADSRAARFIDDFAAQWLEVRNIHAQEPDQLKFPDFDPTLREAMARETELFMNSQIRDDRPIPELLSANYTYLNEQLARHYGIDDIYGSHFRRVTVTDDRRIGLLGQASILTVSSYADRTSVVLRGKWILENLLGSPPPPPPPNVPPLKQNDGKSPPASLRARMEAHRANAVCASCHSRMDPLGFALEHFDATGKWRDDDEGAEINTAVTLAGVTVNTPTEFREALLARKYEFIRTVTEKLMTYALDRGIDYADAPTVRQLGRELEQNDYRWSSLVSGIVHTVPFQMRRAPVPEGASSATVTVAEHR